jgi:hypothetical protein
LTNGEKHKLYAEAKRRNMSGADLLRELIDSLPEPRAKAWAKRTAWWTKSTGQPQRYSSIRTLLPPRGAVVQTVVRGRWKAF